MTIPRIPKSAKKALTDPVDTKEETVDVNKRGHAIVYGVFVVVEYSHCVSTELRLITLSSVRAEKRRRAIFRNEVQNEDSLTRRVWVDPMECDHMYANEFLPWRRKD